MRGAIVAFACVLALSSPAWADDARPWAAGVSDADQTAALDEFKAGNDLFAQGKLADAVTHYRAALARWDHPSIEFNLAVSLIRLDQPVEAYQHLLISVKYGAAPFERPELYQQALDYQKLLEGQLARLTVHCDVAGTIVSLDGNPVLTAPGTISRVLKPGAHELVAHKDGYLTTDRSLVLMPGATSEETVTPIALKDATVFRRRWAVWKPWSVVAGSGTAALVGLGVELLASSKLHEYDQQVTQQCPHSCQPNTLPAPTRDLATSGKLLSRLGASVIVVGLAGVVAGATLVVLDRPHAYVPDLEAGPSGAMVGVHGRF